MDQELTVSVQRQNLTKSLSEHLKQAAIWDEVKDSLKKNALAMSGGHSRDFVLQELWQLNQKCY